MADRSNANVAMTGLAIPHLIPAGVREISMQAIGGDISLAFSASGDARTVANGDVFEDADANLGGTTWYLLGDVGATAQFTYKIGLSE